MSSVTAHPDDPEHKRFRDAHQIRMNWPNLTFKTTVAVFFMALAKVPFIPLIVLYLVAHDHAVTWLRNKLANGETKYSPLYMLTVLVTVGFWTGIACWLWQSPDMVMRTCAIGLLFATPMLGATRGYRNIPYLVVTCAVPMAVLLFLGLESLPASSQRTDLLLTLAPVACGIVVLTRSVRSLRRRDERIRKSDAERSRLLLQLEQSRAHLEQITELSGVAGWEIELPGRDCRLSENAIKILGLSVTPTVLDELLSHLTSESALAFQVELGNARRFGKSVDVDVQLKVPTESPRWIRLVGKVMHREDGTSRFIGAMQDLSERVAQLEKERQDEVSTSLARLSARTASEFKKDLNEVSRSLAELSRRAKRGTFEHMLVHGMRLSLNRALDTAHSLQAFGAGNRIEAGVVNINACVSHVVSATSRLMPAGLCVVARSDGQDLPALLDAAEFDLALLHLILNARDAMDNGGEILVTTGVTLDGWSYVEVQDNGPGIRPDLQARIFEPFYSTKRAKGGRGMGLSIVRGFVDQANGRLDVRSEPGIGSLFRLSFPPVCGDDIAAAKTVQAATRGTMLLVHEGQAFADTLAIAMQKEGFAARHVLSAKEGLERVDGSFRIDSILISNEQARSLAGQALAARLQRNSPQTRLIVLASQGDGAAVLPCASPLLLDVGEAPTSLAVRIAGLLDNKSLPSSRPA